MLIKRQSADLHPKPIHLLIRDDVCADPFVIAKETTCRYAAPTNE